MGNTERLQRTAIVIQCKQFIANKKTLSRNKDEADLEALGEN
jgi:hypothetical protein